MIKYKLVLAAWRVSKSYAFIVVSHLTTNVELQDTNVVKITIVIMTALTVRRRRTLDV